VFLSEHSVEGFDELWKNPFQFTIFVLIADESLQKHPAFVLLALRWWWLSSLLISVSSFSFSAVIDVEIMFAPAWCCMNLFVCLWHDYAELEALLFAWSIFACVRPSVMLQCLWYALKNFLETFATSASWDGNELISFWGLKGSTFYVNICRKCCFSVARHTLLNAACWVPT